MSGAVMTITVYVHLSLHLILTVLARSLRTKNVKAEREQKDHIIQLPNFTDWETESKITSPRSLLDTGRAIEATVQLYKLFQFC